MNQQRLRELFTYDPTEGVFRHRHGRNAGKPAGGLQTRGYRQIRVDGRLTLAHQMAWVWVYDVLPPDQIDHRNGNKDDNRIRNLRDATNHQNAQNRSPIGRGASGHRNVSWSALHGKWRVIVQRGRPYSFGLFDKLDDAVAAAVRARRQLFTHHREPC